MLMLSPHFSIDEAEHSYKAKLLGIKNHLVKRDHVVAAVHLATFVAEPIREKFGPFSPSSWYRSFELNKEIAGASSSSKHMLGEAIDLEIPGVSNLALATWIEDSLDFDELILEAHRDDEPTSGWVHVSFALGRNHRRVRRFRPWIPQGTKGRWSVGLS